MTADLTYPSVFQARRDGNAYVPTGKTLTIESSGTLTVEAGATVTIASTALTISGAVVTSTGAYIAIPVNAVSSTAGTLLNHGLNTLSSTGIAAFTLAAPTAKGQRSIIANIAHGATTVTKTITLASGTMMNPASGSTAAVTQFVFLELGVVECISDTTANWVVVSNQGAAGNVTFS